MDNKHLNRSNQSGLAAFKASLFFKIIDWCLIYSMVFLCITVDTLAYSTSVRAAELPPGVELTQLIQVGSSTQTGVKRITRSDFDFTYTLNISYIGNISIQQVKGHLTSLSPATQIIDADIDFGNLTPGQTLTGKDTYTIRQDRTVPFNPSDLKWSFTYNHPPVADAGLDQSVPVGAEVQLDGAGSTDAEGDSLTYRWTFTARPNGSVATLDSLTPPKPRFIVDRAGRYILSLIVNDGNQDSIADTVVIDTENSRPIADAGPDQTVATGDTVYLNGSASRDPDGDALQYTWTLQESPDNQAELNFADSANPHFTATKAGRYVVHLIVSDGKLDSEADLVIVSTRNSAPVADAGPDQNITLGDPALTLHGGNSTDIDGQTLTYRWSILSAPDGSTAGIDPFNAAEPSFKPGLAGLYIVQLIVNDGEQDSAPDTAQITVASPPPPENRPPRITSSPLATGTVGQLYNYDVDATDPDISDILGYSLQVSGPGMLIDSISGLISWTPSEAGDFEITAKVQDQGGLSGTQNYTLKISAAPPVNRAPQITSTPVTTATAGQLYSYDVDATDPDGDALTYALTQAPGDMTIDKNSGVIQWTPPGNNNQAPSVTVIVTDSGGLNAEQGFTISVSIPNQLPQAQDDSFEADLTQPLIIGAPGVLANDSDADQDPLTAILQTPPANGTVDLKPDGGFTFAPNVLPPGEPLQVKLKWAWTGSTTLPDSRDLMMTPAVIDLNGDKVPDIIFGTTATQTGGNVEIGVLRAIRGDTGAELFTVTDAVYQINTASSVAVGDIDGDAHPEIIATDTTGRRVIVFEHDGTFKWRSPLLETINWGTLSLADLDGDGKPEIIVGRQVLNSDGTLRWTGQGGTGGVDISVTGGGPVSLVADIDLDGVPEVVAGNTAYAADGSVKWQAPIGDGYTAVGNFDSDVFAEVVLVTQGMVYLLEHDGSIKWGPVSLPGGGLGGPPTIADFDGDGQPEIGIAGAARYAVFETDGSAKWQSVTQDISSNVTGSSVFDFEGDGSAEVVYRDELKLRVYRGTDGTVLFETPMGSATYFEYPLVADIDGDGHAEIVTCSDHNLGVGPASGLYVFSDINNRWVATRKIWNQHSYHITNINEDGTIPRQEAVNWLLPGLNNFRLNSFGPRDTARTDSFTYKASDGKGESNLATVNLTAKRPNRSPVITSTSVTTGKVGEAYNYDVDAFDPDPQDTLTFALGQRPNGMSINQTTGLISWTPVDSQAGSQAVTVSVADSGGLSESQTFTVTVTLATPPNRAPVAQDESFTTAGTVLQQPAPGVLANDSDGDMIIALLVSGPANGTVNLSPDGSFTYTPNFGFVGTDTFTYKASDGKLDSNLATVIITVTKANQPPVITSTPQFSKWTQLTPTGEPPTSRTGSGSQSYDANNDRLIVFGQDEPEGGIDEGGYNKVRVLTNATGLAGNSSWVKLAPTGTGPVWRKYFSSVYDFTSNRLIIYGGCIGHCEFYSDTTWVLTNANGLGGTPEWLRMADAEPRIGMFAGYDAVNNRMILFGGLDTSITDRNDVRILVDANGIGNPQWIDLVTEGTSPPARAYVHNQTVYDPISNRLILFGGITQHSQGYNDSWVLTHANGLGGNSQWTQLNPVGTPPPAGAHSVVYDPNSNRLMVFGFYDVSTGTAVYANDTWVLTHANGMGGTPEWIKLAPTGATSPHTFAYGSSGYSLVTNRKVVEKGDTWVLTNASGNCTANQPCDYDVEASDADAGDVLSYALVQGPAGMTIEAGTGQLHWTPGVAQTGTHDVTVKVTDAGGLSAAQSFQLTVAQVAVPNMQGLAPEWAEAMLQAAGLNTGAKSSLGGAITLNFDTLPSEQGWFFDGQNTGGSEQMFSITDGVLRQDTTVGPGDVFAMYKLKAVDTRLPLQLQARTRVIAGGFVGVGLYAETVTEIFSFHLNPQTVLTNGQTWLTVANQDNTVFHDYLLEGQPGEQFNISIDGLSGLQNISPLKTSSSNQDAQKLLLGDPTVTGGNALAEYALFNFTQPQIATQIPAPGTLVNPASAVDLGIQDGPATQTVPAVSGLAQTDAETDIAAAGLLVGNITTEASTTVPGGSVIRQKPVAGTHIMKNFKVDLVVSSAPGNRPPSIISTPVTTANTGELYNYDVDATDPDAGDTLIYSLGDHPAGMSMDNATGFIQWTPSAEQTGTHSVAVSVADSGGMSQLQTFTVTVTLATPPNRAPVAQDEPFSTAGVVLQQPAPGVLANDSDPDGDMIIALLVSGPANGTVNLSPDGSFTYTPNAGFVGTDSFTYKASDGKLDSNLATVTINVLPENSRPTANGQAFGMLRAIPFLPPFWSKSGTITLSGEDPDGDPLSYELVDRPIYGELKGTPPSLTYVPSACYAGADRLTFKVHDGKLDSQVATVDIHVGEDCNRNGVVDPLDIANGTSKDCNANGRPDECDVAIKGRGFTDQASWSAYDPGAHGVGTDPDGYSGGAYDGRYVYFVPYYNGTDYSGEILRYDTQAEFGNAEAWKTYDLSTQGFGGAARGFSGAVFDGRYVYFVPAKYDKVARFDTQGEFGAQSSWTVYSPLNARIVSSPGTGFVGAVFDGRYVYFVPHTRQDQLDMRGEVLRLDTTAEFAAPQAWSVFDPSDHGIGTVPARGFADAVFDGRYIYFVPLDWKGGGLGYNGQVLRYDTQSDFGQLSSWSIYDSSVHGTVTDPHGYFEAAYDGRYVYFGPYAREGVNPYSQVLRYDTQLGFQDSLAWSTIDPGAQGVGQSKGGYRGVVYDCQNVYFVPYLTNYWSNPREYNDETLRYDTKKQFQSIDAWTAYNPATAGHWNIPQGYDGAVFDGRYLYFAPTHDNVNHGTVLRYDTWVGTPDAQGNGIPDSCESHSPIIISTPVTAALVGTAFVYDVNATPLNPGDTLTFSLDTAPAGMTINSSTGLIQWTPASSQASNHPVTVKVTDQGGLSATQSFDITVTGNQSPSITSTPPSFATEGQPYAYAVQASDPDAGDTLTYSLLTAPAGTSINPSSGLISWTPTASQIGTQPVEVQVQDQDGAWATQSFTVIVESALVSVPNVTGYSQADAQTLLLAARLTVGNVLLMYDETYAAGVVLSQQPLAGTSINRNSAVNLIVSKGPAPATVPGVAGLTQAQAYASLNAAYLNVGAVTTAHSSAVAAGLVISQNPAAGVGLPKASAVDLVISLGPVLVDTPNVVGLTQAAAEAALAAAHLSVGSVGVKTSDTVPAGNVISQNPPAGTSVPEGAAVSLVISSGQVVSGYTYIVVLTSDTVVLTGQTTSFSATGILPDGSSEAATDVTWSSSNPAVATINSNGQVSALTEGTTTISAKQGSVIGSVTLTVKAASPGDNTPPDAAITAPVKDASVTEPTAIIGTASDANFLKYELSLSPVGQNQFTVIKTGDTPVTNGTLGMFDPTLLINDQYTLRLMVWDRNNEPVQTEIRVQVSREQKVGNFTVAFQDISVPMACMPLTVTRVYDSRDRRKGDFGVGWRLDINTLRLRESGKMGSSWHVDLIDKPGPFGILLPTYVMSEDDIHKVSLTLPDGHVEEFDLRASPMEVSAFTTFEVTSITYEPRPGTVGTLEAVVNDSYWELTNTEGSVDFINLDAEIYDPRQYRYTTPDGSVYLIDKVDGVKSVQCANGQQLDFGPNGISHSDGVSAVFTRDAQGRITTIADPAGNTHRYEYDGNGDLISYTDPENNQTRFTYDYRHYLLDILDPRGVKAVRNEYDANGRLTSNTDAAARKITYNHDLVARKETVTDRLGHATEYEYDNKGNVLRQTDALGNATTFTYDAVGNQLTRTDPLGQTTSMEYDTRRNVLRETDPLDHLTRYTYHALGGVRTITDPLARVTGNSYDSKSNLLSTADPLGNVTTYSYDKGGIIYPGSGLMTARTDALGNMTRYNYDTQGRMTTETDPQGHVTSYDYDANGNRTKETRTRTLPGGSTEALVTTFEYDKLNRLVKTTQPDGSTSQTVYNAIGKQAQTVDALGRSTQYEYDDLGHLLKTTYPDGAFETSGYDAEGRRIESIDRAGRKTVYTYDALGRLTKTTYADGTSSSTTYDNVGQVIANTDALGHVTSYSYDDAGRRTKVTDALGHVTQFVYDAAGNQSQVIDANGHVMAFVYDNGNRRTAVIYPEGSKDQTGYDALGRNISKTDQAGKVTQFAYDALGRLITVTDALGQVTAYAYDERGNQLSQRDANGHTTTFAYDDMGWRISRTLPEGQTEHMAYNAAGNLIAKTDFNGKTTTYAYDELNRLITKTPDVSLGEPAVTYDYTVSGQRAAMLDAGGLTSYSYDARDRLIEKATPQGILTYTYNGAGQLDGIQSNHAGGVDLSYSYDALNRLAQVTDQGLGNCDTTYSYDNAGSLAGYIYPNGVETAYIYNALNRLTQMTVNKGATSLASYAYTLGATGNRLSVAELSGRTVNYAYDELYRLTRETISGAVTPGQNGDIVYTYDPVGNRLTRTSTVGGIANQSFSYNANDQLNTDAYDANGNTIGSGGKTYGYDSDNRLVSQNGVEVQIVYDGDGNRVTKTVGGVTTQYLIDTLNPTGYAQVLEEIENGSVTRRYSYGSDLISQSLKVGSDWKTYFYGYDGHGSVRFLTDLDGLVTDRYDYEGFGNLVNQEGTTANCYLYSGEQRDASLGLDYLRARWLNTTNGRFFSLDPLIISGHDPRTLHKYVYASNFPTEYVDPSGLFFSLIDVTLASEVRLMLANVQADAGFRVLEGVRAKLLFGESKIVSMWDALAFLPIFWELGKTVFQVFVPGRGNIVKELRLPPSSLLSLRNNIATTKMLSPPQARLLLLNLARDNELVEMLGRLYRETAVFGDGGTADAILHTASTGNFVGAGTGTHLQKGLEEFLKLKNWLLGGKFFMKPEDELIVEFLFDDLLKALATAKQKGAPISEILPTVTH